MSLLQWLCLHSAFKLSLSPSVLAHLERGPINSLWAGYFINYLPMAASHTLGDPHFRQEPNLGLPVPPRCHQRCSVDWITGLFWGKNPPPHTHTEWKIYVRDILKAFLGMTRPQSISPSLTITCLCFEFTFYKVPFRSRKTHTPKHVSDEDNVMHASSRCYAPACGNNGN